MVWVIGIITFICAFLGATTLGWFILSCISSIINPQLSVDKDGQVREKNNNSRLMFLLITSIMWALVIALPWWRNGWKSVYLFWLNPIGYTKLYVFLWVKEKRSYHIKICIFFFMDLIEITLKMRKKQKNYLC